MFPVRIIDEPLHSLMHAEHGDYVGPEDCQRPEAPHAVYHHHDI